MTVLFCDVAGFTATGDRLDPEALRTLQSRYFDDARSALERHGATVEKFIGDAVMAVFGVPQVHEDDALRAVRAAVELRAAVASLGLQARIGINTGEVVAGTGDALVTGDAVNVAARLEQAAEPGVILIGDATHRLVSGAVTSELAGPLEAKGKSEPLRAWELLDVRPDAEAVPRRLDSPMVGRDRERALLRHAFDRAVDERSCHLFTILGPAGVGKSRLVAELTAAVGGSATIVSGRCLPYGDGITFWPLYEILDQIGGEHCRDIRERLERGGSAPEELFLAVRRVFEELARERPLVAVLDDVHWAEPAFLDFLDHVSDWSRDAPILLVCLARPELLDERPSWGGGKLNATSVLLEPLGAPECELLLRNLLSEGELGADARRRILEAADGNPLFIEEMLEMLIDDGLLEWHNGSWVAASDLTQVTVPPTIQALLAARIDRLSRDERDVMERAAVEGKVFHRGAVAALSAREGGSDVTAHLLALVRKELVRPEQSDFDDEDAFRFRHLLVRDAAYESLPKAARAELHERFAEWLASKVGADAPEYEEILGYHLEQAYRYGTELAAADERLARLAADKLTAAGSRAERRGDVTATAHLFERALALLPESDPLRLELMHRLAVAVTEHGDFGRAEALVDETLAKARAVRNRRAEAYALLQHAYIKGSSDPQWLHQHELAEVREALAIFEELGDHAGLARAWRYAGLFEFWGGHCERALAALEQADAQVELVPADERAGTHAVVVWTAFASLMHGPFAGVEADARVVELASRDARLDTQASALAVRARLAAMLGRCEDARAFAARSKEIFEELGMRVFLGGFAQSYGTATYLCEGAAAAEVEYRRGYERLKDVGETGILSTLTCYLGRAVYEQDRYDEALALSEEAERLGSADDVMTQCEWRALRARVFARLGRLDEAERLADEAVALVKQTDYVDEIAGILSSHADVLELAGKARQAESAYAEALALHEQKGNLVAAGRVRERLERLRDVERE